jgi:hypothetical protein
VPCALPTACLTIPPDTGVFGCIVSLDALDLLRPSADGVDVGENEAALVADLIVTGEVCFAGDADGEVTILAFLPSSVPIAAAVVST